jgi:predicted nucleotide-binding protein
MPSQQALEAARRRESTVDALMEEALVGAPPQQAAPPPPNYQNPAAVLEAFERAFAVDDAAQPAQDAQTTNAATGRRGQVFVTDAHGNIARGGRTGNRGRRREGEEWK